MLSVLLITRYLLIEEDGYWIMITTRKVSLLLQICMEAATSTIKRPVMSTVKSKWTFFFRAKKVKSPIVTCFDAIELVFL